MSNLKIKQVKSGNGEKPAARETLRSLRLGKINRVVEYPDSPQLRGMLHRVRHLVEVEQ